MALPSRARPESLPNLQADKREAFCQSAEPLMLKAPEVKGLDRRQACVNPGSCHTRNIAPPAKPNVMCAWRYCFTSSLLLLALAGCAKEAQQAVTPGRSPAAVDAAARCSQVGMASWYRGSSRDRASPQDLVAAHRSLPFGTSVRVTEIDTGQSIVVRINDRGPFGHGRIIDLSKAAADQLGMRHDGVALVRLEPTGWAGASEGCPFQQSRSD